MSVLVGLDIGGTKCAVSIGREEEGEVNLLARSEIPTPGDQTEAMEALCALADKLLGENVPAGIGISAGGPLDAATGMLFNPPNLPGWKNVSLTAFAGSRLRAPAVLENDANACALAEWRWGAGQGSHTMDNLCFTLDHRLPGVWRNPAQHAGIRAELEPQLGVSVFDQAVETLTQPQKFELVYTRVLLQRPKIAVCVQPFMGADVEQRMLSSFVSGS